MQRVLVVAIAVLGSGQLVSPVGAQDQAQGRELAEKLCARCHAIGPRMTGRHPNAPSFQEIAGRYPVWNLQEALAEGILVGHPDMPKFQLKPAQINALLTYMDTLGPTKEPVR